MHGGYVYEWAIWQCDTLKSVWARVVLPRKMCNCAVSGQGNYECNSDRLEETWNINGTDDWPSDMTDGQWHGWCVCVCLFVCRRCERKVWEERGLSSGSWIPCLPLQISNLINVYKGMSNQFWVKSQSYLLNRVHENVMCFVAMNV